MFDVPMKTKRYSCSFHPKNVLRLPLLLAFSLQPYNQLTIIKYDLR